MESEPTPIENKYRISINEFYNVITPPFTALQRDFLITDLLCHWYDRNTVGNEIGGDNWTDLETEYKQLTDEELDQEWNETIGCWISESLRKSKSSIDTPESSAAVSYIADQSEQSPKDATVLNERFKRFSANRTAGYLICLPGPYCISTTATEHWYRMTTEELVSATQPPFAPKERSALVTDYMNYWKSVVSAEDMNDRHEEVYNEVRTVSDQELLSYWNDVAEFVVLDYPYVPRIDENAVTAELSTDLSSEGDAIATHQLFKRLNNHLTRDYGFPRQLYAEYRHKTDN